MNEAYAGAGASARTGQTQLIPDVNKIQGHIVCTSSTQSEIVVPIFDQKEQLQTVLDVDSDQLNTFDSIDQHYLENLCWHIGRQLDK